MATWAGDRGEGRVPVGVDEARDQGLAGAVDLFLGGGIRGRVTWCGRADGGDGRPGDRHIERAVDPSADAVEHR